MSEEERHKIKEHRKEYMKEHKKFFWQINMKKN